MDRGPVTGRGASRNWTGWPASGACGGGAGQGGSEADPGRALVVRQAGARGFEELVTMARSAKIFLPVRTATWALDGTGNQG
jgi:hypothetical protein